MALALLLGASCTFPPWAPEPPTRVSLNIRDGQQNVALDQALVFQLSGPVDPARFAGGFSITPAVPGTLTTSPDHRSFRWTTAGGWADLTAYTVHLAAVKDRDGHSIQAARWRFTTTLVPRVLGLATAGGEVVAAGSEVPLGTGLKIRFNTAMDPAAVVVLVGGTAAALAWAPDRLSAAIPAAAIPAGDVPIQLAAGARDAAGRALPDPWSVSVWVVYRPAIKTVALQAPALVQIPNDPPARDQIGLQAATMVFESVSEGGITRFTALFAGAPARIGPVRSARLISIKLARHYHGMLFASGTSQGTSARLAADPVPYLADDGDNRTFYRVRGRPAPNNLLIDGTTLARSEEQAGLPVYRLPAAPPPAFDGPAASDVVVPTHRSVFSYDAPTGTYLMREDGHLMADADFGQALRIQTVVVLHTQVTVTSIIEDSLGAHGLDYALDSAGRAEVYAYGRTTGATWSSADRSSPFTFKLDTGATIAPAGGLTWVAVVP